MLRKYLDGWIAVMAEQTLKSRAYRIGPPRLLLVDGFAGPGRYATGEPGSPLLILDALLSHTGRGRWDGVQFIYLFIEHDKRRIDHLHQEVTGLGALPENVTVHIEHGEFETTFGQLLDQTTSHGKVLVPTFAFIDPFGYSTSSMSLTGKLLAFPRCEVLVFLPLSFVHRFVGRDGQDAALTSLFGCEDWRAAIPLQGAARREFLLDLFERQLGANPTVEHVRSFQLRTHDGNDYRLVFGLGHDKALDLAKDAMWKVDPIAGTSYTATSQTGQEVLFAPTVDTAPLLADLPDSARPGSRLRTRSASRVSMRCSGWATCVRRRSCRPRRPGPSRSSASRESAASTAPVCASEPDRLRLFRPNKARTCVRIRGGPNPERAVAVPERSAPPVGGGAETSGQAGILGLAEGP